MVYKRVLSIVLSLRQPKIFLRFWINYSQISGKRSSARVNFGTRTSAQVINFGTLLFHGAEVNISIKLGAEVIAMLNIDCSVKYSQPRPSREVNDGQKGSMPGSRE